jgi:hypothetical protein
MLSLMHPYPQGLLSGLLRDCFEDYLGTAFGIAFWTTAFGAALGTAFWTAAFGTAFWTAAFGTAFRDCFLDCCFRDCFRDYLGTALGTTKDCF